jgi:hypothetical protein
MLCKYSNTVFDIAKSNKTVKFSCYKLLRSKIKFKNKCLKRDRIVEFSLSFREFKILKLCDENCSKV